MRRRTFGSADSTFNCEVCMEDIPSCYRFGPISTNRHKHSAFCRACMVKYIRYRIRQGKEVKCPIPGCNWTLDPSACRDLVTRKAFDQWSELLSKSSILGYDRCYCPNRDCRELIISECSRALKGMKIECPSCKKTCCFRCSNPWHAGSCDIELIKEIKKWTRCPGCKYYVERRNGCSHMSCRCGTQFCYLCGRKKKSHGEYHDCSWHIDQSWHRDPLEMTFYLCLVPGICLFIYALFQLS